MKFIITGGGTGGHLVIAATLLEALLKRGHEAIFIGSVSGQDRMWFQNGSAFKQTHFLDTTGVVNKKGLVKLMALFQIFRAFFQSRTLMKHYQPDALISVGGFSAAPASLAALSKRIAFFIHEQNAVEGRLNRLLKPYARAFFSSYDEHSPVQGYPVSEKVFVDARIRTSVKTIIFLGGSQGAQFINNLALKLAPELRIRGIRMIHQCGERDYERVNAAYQKQGVDVELYAFTKELPRLLAESDLAVSRSGASTLWELCANGLPAFFVPYPYAAGDHQFYNADFLVQKGLGWCEREANITTEMLLELLSEDLQSKSEQLMALSEKDAAVHIIQTIEEMI